MCTPRIFGMGPRVKALTILDDPVSINRALRFMNHITKMLLKDKMKAELEVAKGCNGTCLIIQLEGIAETLGNEDSQVENEQPTLGFFHASTAHTPSVLHSLACAQTGKDRREKDSGHTPAPDISASSKLKIESL